MSGIQMALLGAAGDRVDFIDANVSAINSGGGASAAYRVNTNGSDYQGVNGTFTVLTQWVTPASSGGNYEVFATVTAGSLSSGTTGSWVATSTSPTWTRSQAVIGSNDVTLTMQVRQAGGTAVLDTWTVYLYAERV